MRKKTPTLRIAYLNNISIDEIVNKHIEIATRARYEVDGENSSIIDKGDGVSKFPSYDIKLKVIEEGGKAPRKAVLHHKYIFLLSEIIMRCRASKNNCIQLNYDNHIEVLGKHYTDMLYTLEEMRIIFLGDSFDIGRKSRTISLRDWDNVAFSETQNIKVIEYYQKMKELKISSCKDDGDDDFDNDCEFVQQYNKCLSLIELKDYDGAIQYINTRTFEKKHSKYYYTGRIEDFNKDELGISSIDRNGRIYHYFTNLPKSLKRFFNFKYQLDISNSHPLLFSYFLKEYYNINKNIIDIFVNIDYNILYNIHNKGKQLRKILKDNKIDVPNTDKLPNDVLEYIYVTMKGRFWDNFLDIVKSLNRGELKANLFREVFYSHSLTSRKKEYCKLFADIYPNVWSFIRKMKKEESENLPNMMMKLESELFHKILSDCFEKGWKVISIHDAVLVLDVAENSELDVNELRGVMMDAYYKKDIIPNISLDEF